MLRRYVVICGLFEGYPGPSLAEVLRQGSPAPRSRARVGVDSRRVQSHIHGAFPPAPLGRIQNPVPGRAPGVTAGKVWPKMWA